MRFRVEGTNTRGWADGPFSIEAPSAEEARRRAELAGIAVTAVTPSSHDPGQAGRAGRIRPRPDLASGTRNWPQLVTPSRGARVKRLLGLVIALAVVVCLVVLFYLYLAF